MPFRHDQSNLGWKRHKTLSLIILSWGLMLYMEDDVSTKTPTLVHWMWKRWIFQSPSKVFPIHIVGGGGGGAQRLYHIWWHLSPWMSYKNHQRRLSLPKIIYAHSCPIHHPVVKFPSDWIRQFVTYTEAGILPIWNSATRLWMHFISFMFLIPRVPPGLKTNKK